MATLDEYASLLAGLKKTYGAATDKGARDKIAADGTALRQKAFADKIDLTQLDAAATKLIGGSPFSAAQQNKYSQQNIGAAHSAIAQKGVDTIPNINGNMQYTNDDLKLANTYQTQLEKMLADGFKYDYNTDSSYLALKANMEAGVQSANRTTEEVMNDRGIINSSTTQSMLNNNAQKGQLALTSAIPGLEANAYGKWHQGFQDLYNMMGSAYDMGTGERQFVYDQADKNAAMDGTYEDPQAMALINGIIDLKGKWANATPDQQAVMKIEAQTMRDKLSSVFGIDAEKLFGGGVGLKDAMANASKAGKKTVAQQQIEKGDKRYDEEWKYKKEQDKISNQNASSGNSLGWAKFNYDQHQTEAMNRWIGDLIGVPDRKTALAYLKEHNAEITGKDKLSMLSLYEWVDQEYPQEKSVTPESHTPTFDEANKFRTDKTNELMKNPAFLMLPESDRAQHILEWMDFFMNRRASPPVLPQGTTGGFHLPVPK